MIKAAWIFMDQGTSGIAFMLNIYRSFINKERSTDRNHICLAAPSDVVFFPRIPIRFSKSWVWWYVVHITSRLHLVTHIRIGVNYPFNATTQQFAMNFQQDMITDQMQVPYLFSPNCLKHEVIDGYHNLLVFIIIVICVVASYIVTTIDTSSASSPPSSSSSSPLS